MRKRVGIAAGLVVVVGGLTVVCLGVCAGLPVLWTLSDRGPVEVVQVDPEPEPLPALPSDPFHGLCEAGCGRLPDEPPRALRRPNRCPTGTCRRQIELRFPDNDVRIELDGQLLTEPTTVDVWTGPAVAQVYFSWGEVARCSFEIAPGTEALDVSWFVHESDPTRDRVFYRLYPGAEEVDCSQVKSARWRVSKRVPGNAIVLDHQLAAAREALTAGQFGSDRDVTRWLRQHDAIGGGLEVARTHADGRASDGTAMLVERVPLWCRRADELCYGDYAFTGPLSVTGRLTFHGKSKRSFCGAWDTSEDLVFQPYGWVAQVIATDGPCTGRALERFTIPRVPFDAPVNRPRIPDSRTLPKRVSRPWRLPAEPQPSVVHMPSGVETSIDDVGAWLASVESDPYLRVKALHDWAATRIEYDVPALSADEFPPQDAASVFTTRKGVCAGYANLLVALGEAAGVEIVYVGGHSRDRWGEVSARGHAWNAARIEGRWYLLDATWNAGGVGGGAFSFEYDTRYLFTPPELFGGTHHPSVDAWQLVEEPISDVDFLERPVLGDGVVLLSEASSETTDRSVSVRVASEVPLTAWWRRLGSDERKPCEVDGSTVVAVECQLERPGEHRVDIESDNGLVGSLEVTFTRSSREVSKRTR